MLASKIPVQNVDADAGNRCGTHFLALMLTLTVMRPFRSISTERQRHKASDA